MAEFERLKADWLSFDEALARILARARPTPAAALRPLEALGRSVARPVTARATLPAWPNSAMDGFAARSADLARAANAPDAPVSLPVAGLALPGAAPLEGVREGAAVRIMTGGPLPAGFDTVIRVEHTDGEAEPGTVVVRSLADIGKHVRSAGRDMERGGETVPAGTVVHSGALAVIAASGQDRVAVHRRPRVGVLSSGDELVGPEDFDLVARGLAVPDTNRAMIAAAVAESGGVPVDLGVAPDDPEALRRLLAEIDGGRAGGAGEERGDGRDGPEIDLLVSTGGASMGERDLLKRILLELPFDLDFWRARVRPGSPLSFGRLRRPRREGRPRRDLPVFGLPGNPASAFTTFHVFVAPYLRAMLGAPPSRARGVFATAVADSPLKSPPRMTHFYRVALTAPQSPGGPVSCAPTGPQGSGLVRSLRDADGLAVVPEGAAVIERGEQVSVLLLPRRW